MGAAAKYSPYTPVHKVKVDLWWPPGRGHRYCSAGYHNRQSQSKTWKELHQPLKPFVDEFGFLNQDIGFLANVYPKSKERSPVDSREFQQDFEHNQPRDSSSEFFIRRIYCSEGCTYEGNILDDNAQVNQVEDIKLKLILYYIIY